MLKLILQCSQIWQGNKIKTRGHHASIQILYDPIMTYSHAVVHKNSQLKGLKPTNYSFAIALYLAVLITLFKSNIDNRNEKRKTEAKKNWT